MLGGIDGRVRGGGGLGRTRGKDPGLGPVGGVERGGVHGEDGGGVTFADPRRLQRQEALPPLL